MSQPVTWVIPANVTAQASDNKLTKNASGGSYNGGAESAEILTSGDGYIESTVIETNTQRAFGLGAYRSGGYTAMTQMTICVELGSGATYRVFESGSGVTTAAAYSAADVFRVAVEGTTYVVRKNGTIVWTSALTVTYPLRAACAVFTLNATIGTPVIDGTGFATTTFKDTVMPLYFNRLGIMSLGGGTVTPSGTASGQIYPYGEA